MLETLRIQNYALIDALDIDFRDGFNVLTGETGAGKSIIVGALNLVLGARASGDALREGAKQAKVDAVFHIPQPSRRLRELLKQHEIECEEGQLILSRVITSEGRSRGYAGGNLVPISVLAEIGDELVDLHGQHEHQSLLRTDRQLDLLDAFAGTEPLVDGVGEKAARLREMEKAIAELESFDRERIRRAEFLRHEIGEIDAAGLHVGEEDELKSRRNLITNAERIFALASSARSMLYDGEETSSVMTLDSALGDIQELAQIDGCFRALSERLAEARGTIEEAASELRAYTERLEFDPQELESVNGRLALISDLRRKYGNSVEAILDYRAKAAAEIDLYDSRDKRLADMQAQHKLLFEETMKTAQDVSLKRKNAARKLDKLVTGALQDLGMKGGKFETHSETAPLSATGIDKVEFLLAANPGEKVKPLRQVASGGEVSRIMLALKAVFAQADRIPTLIFDEIDAGVGGHIARNVAAKIGELARSHQVICITHLAQIAAVARTHHHAAKTTQRGKTATTVVQIEGAARVDEIARLLDGSVSDVSVKHAKALLEGAEGA